MPIGKPAVFKNAKAYFADILLFIKQFGKKVLYAVVIKKERICRGVSLYKPCGSAANTSIPTALPPRASRKPAFAVYLTKVSVRI